MKLDKRPITTLTLDIIRTSAMWMIIYRDGSGSACHAPLVADAFPFAGLNADEHTTCYPCKAYAPFEPIPWAVVEGEEQIKEWRGLPCKFDAQVTSNWGHSYWALFTRMNDETAYETELRPGFHPSPRRQINPDGTETPVWVWEKDV